MPSAIAAGHFGHDDRGPIRPSREEVREITETHAHRLIFLLRAIDADPIDAVADADRLRTEFRRGIDAYAEDFGQHAADRMEA